MELLKQLTNTPSVPGREDRIRELIRSKVKPLVDEIRVDTMGSLICVRHPRPAGGPVSDNPLKIMLAAHMDQIGFLVKYIDDKGFVRVNPVGGFDTRNLFARRVIVCTEEGDLRGVMNPAGKPVHIASEEERKKVPEIQDFFIDLGLTPEEAKAKVQIGDMVVIDEPLVEIGNTVVAQALDNRVGCWAVLRALEKLEHHNCEIHAVFTVQEEVGLRGAGTAAFGIKPDIALSCDTTLCCDTPGVPDDQQVNRMGEGVSIKIMDSSMIADIRLVQDLERVAKENSIRFQRSILPRGGQDGGAIQRTGEGVRVGVLACPLRFIHTVTETAAVSDLEAYRDLIAAWLTQA